MLSQTSTIMLNVITQSRTHCECPGKYEREGLFLCSADYSSLRAAISFALFPQRLGSDMVGIAAELR